MAFRKAEGIDLERAKVEAYKNLIKHKMNIDPLSHYHPNDDVIIEACGLIPHFIFQADEPAPSMYMQIMDRMDKAYGFGSTWQKKDSRWDVTPDGIYKYDGDPELYPLMSYDFKIGKICIYQHAIVTLQSHDASEKYYTRMD